MRRRQEGNEKARPTERDREQARSMLNTLAQDGAIRSDGELDGFLAQAESAQTRKALRQVLESAQPGLKRVANEDLRASQGDRDEAIRRLELHEREGHLGQAEVAQRRAVVEQAETRREVEAVFYDLPAVETLRSSERLIGVRERDKALGQLQRAFDEHRIDYREFERAKEQVGAARTKEEIQVALAGLQDRAQGLRAASDQALRFAESGKRAAAEGKRRAIAATVRTIAAFVALIVGGILAIAGYGQIALVAAVGSVILFVLAVRALFVSKKS